MSESEMLRRRVEQLMLQGVCDIVELTALLNAEAGDVEMAKERVVERWMERIGRRDTLIAGIAARLEFMERRLWALLSDSTKVSEQVNILKSIMAIMERYISLLKLDRTDSREEDDERIIEEVETFLRGFAEKDTSQGCQS